MKNKVLVSEAEEEEDINKLCIICMDNYHNVVLKPCGHGGLCKECLVSIYFKGTEDCPLCRTVFSKAFVVEEDLTTKGRFKIKQCLDVKKMKASVE